MEINLKEKYLPVGTVVLLKGGKKRVMVTGFCVVSPEIDKKVFDYCGCIYPEGYLNSTQNCLFNHDQIDKIYHVGLVDDEELKFKKQLKEIAPTIDESFADFVKATAEATADAPEAPVAAEPAPVAEPTPVVEPAPVVSEPAPQVAVEPAPVAQPAPEVAAEPSVINFLDESQK